MAIGPITIQGQITRAQDITTIKHNQDNKGMVDQTNFQKHFRQEVDNKSYQVQHKDDTENQSRRFDAKEKGDGSYAGDGGQKRKREKEKEDGKVVLKGKSGFDMKI